MNRPYRIVIAEDHTILREGLRSLLSSNRDLDVVAEAEDGLNAIRCVENQKPDLILMDLSMPRMNGLEAIKEIKRRFPDTKILALTVHKTDEYIHQALQAGADGYVLKDSTHRELETAILSVLKGKGYLSPDVSRRVIESYRDGKSIRQTESTWNTLTKREREIIKLIAEGFKNREIADYLCISTKTVDKHRTNLMKKLDLHNVAGLTAVAIEKGLIER